MLEEVLLFDVLSVFLLELLFDVLLDVLFTALFFFLFIMLRMMSTVTPHSIPMMNVNTIRAATEGAKVQLRKLTITMSVFCNMKVTNSITAKATKAILIVFLVFMVI